MLYDTFTAEYSCEKIVKIQEVGEVTSKSVVFWRFFTITLYFVVKVEVN